MIELMRFLWSHRRAATDPYLRMRDRHTCLLMHCHCGKAFLKVCEFRIQLFLA